MSESPSDNRGPSSETVVNTKQVDRKRIEPPIDPFHAVGLPRIAGEFVIGVPDITLKIRGNADETTVKSTYGVLERKNSIPAVKFSGRWTLWLPTYRAKLWSEGRHAFNTSQEAGLGQLHMLLSASEPLFIAGARGELSEPASNELARVCIETTKIIRSLLEAKK